MKSEVKINLGSGPDGLSGWINFDWGWLPLLGKYKIVLEVLAKLRLINSSYVRGWPGIRLADLRKGIPMEIESVDWIYSSNFMEHLEKYDNERLLGECRRVLKNGGKIRIVVPDLNKLVEKYKKNQNADMFCREFYGFDKDINLGLRKSAIRGHEWMYDTNSFINILEKAGFRNIVVSSYRKSEMPDVQKLDLEIHKELGLYLEAEKVSSNG